MARVLIIEDDAAVAEALGEVLALEGYATEFAVDGAEGLRLGSTADPNVILLDIVLPEIDGYEVLRKLRADGVEAPILMISAKGREIDKVLALELGADDYLTKPFGMAELTARVKALLRRARGGGRVTAVRRIGDLEVDLVARRVRRRGEVIALTRTEFDLLALFLSRPDKVFARDEILERIWGYTHIPNTRTLDNHIFQLRKKIEDVPGEPKVIESVRGVGYRLTQT